MSFPEKNGKKRERRGEEGKEREEKRKRGGTVGKLENQKKVRYFADLNPSFSFFCRSEAEPLATVPS